MLFGAAVFRSEFVNEAVSLLPGVVVAPTVEKFALGGLPAEPSLGGVTPLPFGFGDRPGVQVAAVTGLLFESLVARWMLNERMLLTAGEVNCTRASSFEVPASKLPTETVTSVGASAPLLMQMLKVEMPAAFGS